MHPDDGGDLPVHPPGPFRGKTSVSRRSCSALHCTNQHIQRHGQFAHRTKADHAVPVLVGTASWKRQKLIANS